MQNNNCRSSKFIVQQNFVFKAVHKVKLVNYNFSVRFVVYAKTSICSNNAMSNGTLKFYDVVQI